MKKNNSNLVTSVVMTVCFYFFSCSSAFVNKQLQLKYLSLSDSVTQSQTCERHIEVLYKENSLTEFPSDDRIAFDRLGLNKTDRIKILREYLSFYGDTCVSNKYFSNIYGRSHNRLEISKKNIRYPVEVEALYSMTTMLFKGSVIISPVLINKQTGETCNFKRNDLDIVYKIYREWFVKMKKGNFSELSWPLEGRNYKWLGEDNVNNIETLLKQTL
ncbi:MULTISPECIES: hypothetical protein [Pedobacter]|uniref:hypothetical protein n=1 Tax=Pedobacter TaxID=84567 RepID=UPI0029301ACC|nr:MULTISPECIES: hypothetical protein [Pedobacter]